MSDLNTMFPGRLNYVGPKKGMFGLLHHAQLFESSDDVMERVDYVKREKTANEIAVRLHNMIYLGGCVAVAKRAPLYADYEAKLAALGADYDSKRVALGADYEAKRAALSAEYRAKRAALSAEYRAKTVALSAEILAYIRTRIPDCAWDGDMLRFSHD